MKRIVSLLTAICLTILLSACAGNVEQPFGSESDQQEQNRKLESQMESKLQSGQESESQTEPEPHSEPGTVPDGSAAEQNKGTDARLLYMGQASIRIVTAEGKAIYIDPYAGDGYDLAADLILVTHSHYDHNGVDKVEIRNPDCQIITWKEALADSEHQTFDLGFVTVEAVEAGYNRWHDVRDCVGYVLTFTDGISVYVTGDTSKTEQMPLLAEKEIDYAFYCCDGVYNMDLEEAAECAALVNAKHNIPYHVLAQDGVYFDRARAEEFQASNRMIIDEGEEIELIK